MIDLETEAMDARGDFPYDERSDQMQAEMQRDRQRQQQEIEEAFFRLMADALWAPRKLCSKDDIKLLKWALGVK